MYGWKERTILQYEILIRNFRDKILNMTIYIKGLKILDEIV